MSSTKNRAGSPLLTSLLIFVVVGCGLLFLFTSFAWPVWQVVVVGFGLALFAAVVTYIAGRRRQL